MTAPASPGQGVIPLACGHDRALPWPDAIMCARLGGMIACHECTAQAGNVTLRQIIRVYMPAPDWSGYYRERARLALAEYDARKALPIRERGKSFYPEMAGLLSEVLRGWLEA